MNVRIFGALGMILGMGSLQLRAELEEDQWTRSQTAGGRIRVVARDAALMQQVSVWAARGLAELERAWGVSVPFQADHPLVLAGSDRVDGVTLQQEFRQGILRQRILFPESMGASDSRELARVFTRALAGRVLLAALPADQKESGAGVPAWLELGSAIRLMGEREGSLYSTLVESEPSRRLAYPEEIAGRGRGKATPLMEAEAGLLCRWVFGRGGMTRERRREMWASFGDGHAGLPTAFIHPGGPITDLRELHQHWDLWWQTERRRLMSEFRLTGPVLNTLRQEILFLPGFYGLYREDLDRTRSVRFEQLEDYLDDPAFASAMATWSLRLQPLRLRQPPEINDLIARFQQAISTLAAASREKEKAREELWEDALDQWRQALGELRGLEQEL